MGMGEKAAEDEKEERADINLRAPKANLAEARRWANSIGISLNAWICAAIAEKLERGRNVIPFKK